MKCGGKLPYEIFPGIFSSIDSYSKRVTMEHFRKYGRVPKWFDPFGELGSPIRVPGWGRFQMPDTETSILLTGVPDEILRHPQRGLWIGDYKTARFSDTQDVLRPMYEAQLNAYALIAQQIGLGSVYGLGLMYYEPVTYLEDADTASLIKEDRFFLAFAPKLIPIKLQPKMIRPLLGRAREICDKADCPPARADCRNCSILETVIKWTARSASSLTENLLQSLVLEQSKRMSRRMKCTAQMKSPNNASY